MVEKGRGAEARAILGDMRKLAFAFYLQNGTFVGLTNSDINVGTASDQIPSECRSSHYFYYYIATAPSALVLNIEATRCSAGGKTPNGGNHWYNLVVNLYSGADQWYYDGSPSGF